ncbi:hypothetical protein DFJ74DRAFT_664691 [Hyaloraphidium curvatum]|nr:hypothetical protein DFJ74DRAFT_664691 [Hyaloraphidium curvatum]
MMAQLSATTKELEKALYAKETAISFVTELVRVAPIVIFSQNPRGDTTYVSEHIRDFLGVEPNDCLGRGWARFMHSDDVLAAEARSKAGLAYFGLSGADDSRSVLKEELVRFIRPDTGEMRWATLRQRGFADGSVLGVVFDVSDLKKVERDLERALKVRDEVVANVSHELRTPLNGIIGNCSSLLHDTKLTEEQTELLAEILECSTGLLGIVSDLLLLSRVSAGKIDLVEEQFDPREVLTKLASMFRLRSAEKGVEMVVSALDAEEGDFVRLPSLARADVGRIKQCLINLVTNAFKFTNHGSVTLTVAAVRRPEAQGVETPDGHHRTVVLRFTVADTGQGIPPDFFPQLFQKFTQADQGSSRIHQGAGLGLSIVKTLTEVMGGHVWAESELGKGSTFFLEVPVRIVASQDIVLDRPSADYFPELPATKSLPRMRSSAAGSPADPHAPNGFVSVGSVGSLPRSPGTRVGLAHEAEPGPVAERSYTQASATTTSGTLFGSDAGFNGGSVDFMMAAPHWPAVTMDGSGSLPSGSIVAGMSSLSLADLPRSASQNLLTTEASNVHDDSKLLILAVEDNSINMKVLMKYLARIGKTIPMEVFAAWDGVEAVDVVRTLGQGPDHRVVDLVLMDLQLPLLDGFGSARQMRDPQNIPTELQPRTIVACTANAMEKDRERCLLHGMEGFCTKPIMVDELRQIVESAWQKKLERCS